MINALSLVNPNPNGLGKIYGAVPDMNVDAAKTLAEILGKENQIPGQSAGIGSGKADSFQNMLAKALDYVNDKQQNVTDISQKLITDPDSVDVHDVTTAVAEASMTMELAQNVIQRMLTAWNEITTTR
jgi:flagellar hook-basal body complex protein FliE